ncbi:LysR substrate-binding domain-containing protein [Williamsia soli]|uniref:LysR substrate-binding domain-containing protein n=1 Tax=Williamsia soli TaxID=364929 RepID=UPI001A9F0E84|nr:LysR substrate-binding domain-containing protein [Williamsia soli]
MAVKYTLHQLEYLVAIADTGSISAAAAASHASAGGVSQAIGELENRLGTALFIRRKAKAVTLTAAGARVLADARRILAAAEELQASAGATQNEITGTLSVGCYSTLAPFVIPPMLDDFGGHHDGLDVQVLEGSADEIVGALTDGRCEIGFLYGNDLRDGLDSTVVRTTKPYVILAADHRLASHPAVRLADLADEPLIMFDVPSARNAAQMLASLGLTARIRHFSSNIEVVRGLVARGIGYSILIQRWPINISYEGRPVVAKPIIDVAIERRMVLAWPSGLRQTRRSLALIEFCRNEFLDDPTDLTF